MSEMWLFRKKVHIGGLIIIQVFDIGYNEGGRVPHLWSLVKEDGEKRIITSKYSNKPFFFVRQSDMNSKVKEKIEDIGSYVEYEENAGVYLGEPVCKVGVSKYWQVRKIDKELSTETLEADIPPSRRVLIETDGEISRPDDYLFFDIEIDPTAREGRLDVEEPEGRILGMSAVDNHGNKWVRSYDDEITLVKEFIELTEDYPVISGWNSRNFDRPYIMNRCERLGIDFPDRRFVHIDSRSIYRDVLWKKGSMKLNDVAQKEGIGEKRYDFEERGQWEKVLEMWKNDREEFEAYNLQDSNLLYKLDDKLNLIDIIFSVAKRTHSRIKDLKMKRKSGGDTYDDYRGRKREITLYGGNDNLLLNVGKNEEPRKVWGNRQWARKREEYRGPRVLEPVPGIHSNVVVFDFASFYPSIIKTFNIGLYTYKDDKTGDYMTPHGSHTREPKSLFVKAIEQLEDMRTKFKEKRSNYKPETEMFEMYDSLQFGIKTILLSFYGTLGFKTGRFYNREVVENVTLLARLLLTAVGNICEKKGLKVIYGDSDSLFVKLPSTDKDLVEEAKRYSDLLTEKLNEHVETTMGVDNSQIDFGIDRIFTKLQLTENQKEYAGICIWEDGPCSYLHVKGGQAKKINSPEKLGKFEKNLYKYYLTGKDRKLLDYIKKTKKSLFKGKYDEGLIIRTGLNQPLEEYAEKGKPPHARIAEKMLEEGIEVSVGDKIPYLKVGDRKEDYIPAYDMDEVNLTRKHYKFIWNDWFEGVIEDVGCKKLWKGQKTIGDYDE